MPTTQLDARALAQAIDQVLPAVGKDPKRPALHAVLVEARDGSLRLVATDAHRLVVRDLLPHPPATGAFRVLVDVEAVRRLRTALPHDGTVALEEDGPALTVTTSRSQERLPLLDASFPDYERFLAADPDARRLTALRSAVLAALEPIADKDHVPLAFSQGELRFDGGANADGVSVPAAFQGDDLELAIRPSYMRDAVLHSVGPDVVIEVTDPEQPVVFRSADDGSYTCMVMPVKVASPRRRR